jgi:NADPH:quinone reductase-like Zn-dependent oxidoreductase
MKAIVRTKYGPPEALQFTEVEKPTPKDNEVLIKVRAASVNPLDLFTMRGAPLIRLIPRLRTPKDKRLGVDVAGQVEAVESGQSYDLILDCVGNHSLLACRRVLNPKGTYIMVGAPAGRWMIGPLARLTTALVLSRFVTQKFVTFIARSSKEDLAIMHDLMEAGKVIPVIDKRYSLSVVPEAIRYLEEGHARGKVVITVEYNNKKFSR